MSGIRSASIAAALLGCTLLLSGCTDSSGSGTDSAAGTTASASAESSAESSVSASADPSGEPSPSASSSSAAATPSKSTPTRTATPPPTSKHTTAPVKVPQAPASVPGCRNLGVTSAVKAAVTRAYQRSYPRFVHIAPVPGRFFYGQCGTVRYAATPFDPTSGANEGELVNLQDEGGAMKYFRATTGSDWSYFASDGFPAGPHGCADILQIPDALTAAWRNCSVAG
ncbi:hypothetical protein ABZ883_00320 [Streptomyces sp. NPDC046977]|uniref:hypothetical protein n=1 Tax=Streptomyces sp. NPDC046977 TaxID=3154703 RepID=UPI0033DAC3B4